MNTNLRQSSTVTEAEWQQLEEVGYVRLGVVASETQIDALCERINQIMLGDIRYERMQMQLCPSASDDREMVDFSQNHKGSSLKYRKIQELEMDPLFLDYIQNPLFRDITQKKIGDRVSVFRAMFFNKPAEGGISKNWHQDSGWDLSIPEEITVYTALDPQTRENGCLMVIPHSHKECPFESVNTDEKIRKYAPPERRAFMEMEKGEVVLFKNKLLHSSLVNTTNRPRRAFSVAFVHADTVNMTSGRRFPQVMPEYRPAAKA
jgi:phytanoyl-CoA hydroxylase